MRRTDHTEAALLDAVYRAALFDRESQQAIERLLRLASNALGVSAVILSIVDRERYVLRGHLAGRSSATEETLAPFAPLLRHAYGQPTFVRTEQLTGPTLPGFEPGARVTFAATPLELDGAEQLLGSLAVLDAAPRTDQATIAATLSDVAHELIEQLRLRVDNAALHEKEIHLESQKNVFGLIASGAPIERILSSLAAYLEHQSAGALCVIHLMGPDGRLRVVAGPTLPESLLALVDGIQPSLYGCVCAQAAWRAEPVIMPDVGLARTEVPTLGLMYLEGIRSGWSFPIICDGTVHGTIDLYRMNVGSPTDEELQLISVARSAAQIALDRRRAEAQLRQSEIYHRALIENSSEYVLVLDADGTTRYVSRRVASAVGAAPEDVRALTDIVVPEDRAGIASLLDELVHTQEQEIRLRLVAGDGSVRHLLGTGTNLLTNPAVRGVVINARDVTQQKVDADAVRESEERYRLIARAASDLIWEWDAVRDVVSWPAEDSARFGYTHAELPTERAGWAGLLHPEDVERVEQSLSELLRSHADIWAEEYRFLQKDGGYATVLDRCFVVRGPDGSALRLIGSMMDLTARRALEEQLRHAQRMEAVGRLAGGVAHDFNNLLTVIEGFASLLLDDLGASSEHNGALKEIQQASARAATLTRQLLAFSRRQVLQPRLLDVSDVVRGISGMLRRLIPVNIVLSTELEDAAALVRADVGQLEQVIVNLVINACEAIPGSGVVAVRTDSLFLTAELRRRHPGLQPGHYVRLAVEDDGCGMDESTVSRVFEPFFTTKQTGTGLGLATVYGIVEQSGGHICVHSVVGAGTRFEVLLPVATDVDGAVAPVLVDERGTPAGNEVIFVVEDHRAVRELTCRMLARNGYVVHAAEDGVTAIDMLRAGVVAPDLLLTDVVLPHLNGPAVALRVRELVPDVAVVFMSGYTDEQIGHHGVLEQDVAFVQKPFQASKLLAVVRDQLDSRAATPSALLESGRP